MTGQRSIAAPAFPAGAGTGVFKNQGDCVSFVATDGRNQPH